MEDPHCPECEQDVELDDLDAVQDPQTGDWYHASCLEDRKDREAHEAELDEEERKIDDA